jgi:hypothetical protein
MKAIVFHSQPVPGQTAPASLPGISHLEFSETSIPDLPNNDWVVIKSKIAGIW